MGKYINKGIKGGLRIVGTIGFSKKKYILSIVSCVLALITLIASTFCWYALQPASGTLNGKLETDNGLRVDDLGVDIHDIADKSCLVPASSVDGRNVFFPSDGTDFSASTTSITYRSANAGDKNFSYLKYDFDLMAEANYTSIFIDLDKTHIYFDGYEDSADLYNKSKAIRTALYYDGIEDNKPILFNSSGRTRTTQAVERVDRTDGTCLSTAKQTSYPYRDYSYGKKQIAILDQGEKRRFSFIVWIEGTDEECTDDLIDQKISFSVGFTTSWDNKAKIVFRDDQSNANTHPIRNLVSTNNRKLQLNYNDTDHKIDNYKFRMYYFTDDQNRDCWYCNIPDNAVHDLTFAIYNSDGTVLVDNTVTYEWVQKVDGTPSLNRGDSTTYVNDGVSAGYIRGHWYDGDIEDKGSGFDSGGIIDDDDW